MVKKQPVAVLSEAQQIAADRVSSLRSHALAAGLFSIEKPLEYPKLAPSKGLDTHD